MATLQEIQAAIATEKADEDKIVALLQTLVQANQNLSAQLQQAMSANDPAQLKAVLDQVNANTTAMEEAIAQVSPQTPVNPQPPQTPPNPGPGPTP